MGNSASALPYSIDKQVGAPHDHNGWALHAGKSTSGDDAVSVFVGKKAVMAKTPVGPRHPSMMQLQPAFHHYQNCRRLRHPHILKVHATLDTDHPTAATTGGDGPSAVSSDSALPSATTGDLIIVTEPCISLTEWLLTKQPSSAEIAWGLECIVRGMHFLHASAQMAHGNMAPSSFYVTQSGDVKIWNFSLVTPVGNNNLGPTPHFRQWEAAICPDAYRSPERLEGRWEAISAAGVHAMDSYGLGILIDFIYQGKIPTPLVKAVQRLQTPNIKMRPRLQPLLKCPIFNTPLQKVHLQLEEIAVQPVEQKVTLWQNLGSQLQNGALQEGLAVYKLLPIIKSTIVNICSNEAMMSQDLYRREVLAMLAPLFFIAENFLGSAQVGIELKPLIGLLFVVKDRAVRAALLNKVPFLAQHLKKAVLNSAVFEPMCSGFSDSSSALRELTLKSTLVLVSHLNPPNLEKLSRYLVRLQGDSETTIRTNSIIFIGKIAPNLSETSRQKILLPAVARASKDPFIPCRQATLKTTIQIKEYFSMEEIATKLLPSILPLLLDPITDVRTEGFRVVDTLMNMLRTESDRMAAIATTTTPQAAPVNGGMAAAAPASVPAAPASGSYLSGLSSWMSSSTAPTSPAPTKAMASMQVASAPISAPPQQQEPPPSATVDDGWGDEDDDDDDNWDDPAPAPVATPQSSLFDAMDHPNNGLGEEDPFAALGAQPAKAVRGRSGGKLVVPKKKAVVAAAPATKLKIEKDDIADGWDDF